jgi:hypothetical protein
VVLDLWRLCAAAATVAPKCFPEAFQIRRPDGNVSSLMGSLVKKRRKRMRKKKHKKMLRRTRHQRRK